MDNYNGINQMNQNQYMQPNNAQYQQVSQNGIDLNKYKKSKKKWLKWTLIIGIPAVAIITVILLFVLLPRGYKIDDHKDFSAACKKVFDLETTEATFMNTMSKEAWGYKTGYGVGSLGGPTAWWYEFESEEAAESYFNFYRFGFQRQSPNGSTRTCDLKLEDNYVEYSEASNDSVRKTIVIRDDEYVIYLVLYGDKKEVEKQKEKFLKEIS